MALEDGELVPDDHNQWKQASLALKVRAALGLLAHERPSGVKSLRHEAAERAAMEAPYRVPAAPKLRVVDQDRGDDG